MIKINLLPKQLRRTTTTPPAFLAFAGVTVALLVLAVVLYVYFWFHLVVLQEEVATQRQLVGQLESQAHQVDLLREDINDYKRREQIIVQIKTNRILWSRKLDDLVRLTPPEIWVTHLVVKPYDQRHRRLARAGNKAQGYLELRCYSLNTEVRTITDFRRKLMGEKPFWSHFLAEPIAPNDFSYGFIRISEPAWQRVELKGFRQKYGLVSTIRLDFRSHNPEAGKGKTKAG